MPDIVRVCLNTNNYVSPSGGYKAYNPANRAANAHSKGVGMEEWIGGNQFEVAGKDLKCRTDSGFSDLEDEKIYRMGFLEAFYIKNYWNPVAGVPGDLPRNNWRPVELVINNAANQWTRIGGIRRLRGLTSSESCIAHNYFLRNGSLPTMDAQITHVQAYAPPGANFVRFTPLPTLMSPVAVFSCIFLAKDFSLCNPATGTAVPRYRWRG